MSEETAVSTTFEYPKTFVTEYGDELPLPRPTAKIERLVYEHVGKVLTDFPAVSDLVNNFLEKKDSDDSQDEEAEAIDASADVADNIIDVIRLVLTKVPEPLSHIAKAILGLESVDAVEDKLTYADMIRLLVLFFRLQTSRFSGVSVRLVEDFGLDRVKLSQLAEQAVTDETEV